jgi:acetoin:2,6-dichlorophenolindophenol oxidoreductase subunit beta
VIAAATSTLSYRDGVNDALRRAMGEDDRVILLGEDITGGAGRSEFERADAWGGPFRCTRGLAGDFGRDRVLDTPISEAGFIGAAVGAAATGLRPVAELMFLDFFGACGDALINQAAKLPLMSGGRVRLPLTVRTTIGTEFMAAAQHSAAYHAIFCHIPGWTVVMPATPADARSLLLASIRTDSPVLFVEHRDAYDDEEEAPTAWDAGCLGEALVRRAGSDVTLVAASRMTAVALAAAERLSGEGVDAEVIDLRTVSPLDFETVLASVRRTGAVAVVDEGHARCGIARDLAAQIAERAWSSLRAAPAVVAAPDEHVRFSPPLARQTPPDVERVVTIGKALARSH